MFLLVAKEAKKSKYFQEVYVSSDSKKILDICKHNKIKFILRPKRLSGDTVEKQDVIVHSVKFLSKKMSVGDVVSLQPNSPEFKYKDLNKAYQFFRIACIILSLSYYNYNSVSGCFPLIFNMFIALHVF